MRARYWSSLLLIFALAAPALAQSQDRRGGSLDRVLPHVRQSVPGTFYDAEGPFFGSDGKPTYRLKWMTPDNRIIWFSVDAQSGRVLDRPPSGAPQSRYRDNDEPARSDWQNGWDGRDRGNWSERGRDRDEARSGWPDRGNDRDRWPDRDRGGDRGGWGNDRGGWGDRGGDRGSWGTRDRGSWGAARDNGPRDRDGPRGGWGGERGRDRPNDRAVDRPGERDRGGDRGNWGGRSGGPGGGRSNSDRGGPGRRPPGG